MRGDNRSYLRAKKQASAVLNCRVADPIRETSSYTCSVSLKDSSVEKTVELDHLLHVAVQPGTKGIFDILLDTEINLPQGLHSYVID